MKRRSGCCRGRFANDEAGRQALVDVLTRLQPRLIAVEATGDLETSLMAQVAANAMPIAVIDPHQARDFAKAIGSLGQGSVVKYGVCRS